MIVANGENCVIVVKYGNTLSEDRLILCVIDC
jgi:hypothetical protein